MQTLDAFLRRMGWRWLALPSMVVVLSALALKDVHEHQRAELDASAQGLADAVDVDLQRRVQGLQAVAAAVVQARTSPVLADWYGYSRGYDLTFDSAVVMADSERRMLFNTRVALGTALGDLPKPAGRSVFDEALATGQARFGNVTQGPVMRTPVVSVITSVVDRSQSMALLGLVPLAKFQALLMQRVPEGWHAAVRDMAGQPVASIGGEDPTPAEESALPHRRVIATKLAGWTVAVEVQLPVHSRMPPPAATIAPP